MDEPLPFGSREYWVIFGILLFARGMDFLSTWVATPTLALEGNPIAKKLGWKFGALVNLAMCFLFAKVALTALIISTTSILIAARNFQQAWLMRTMGEENYREWFLERMAEMSIGWYLFCLLAQTGLIVLVGGILTYFSGNLVVPFAIGLGIVAYGLAILFFTSLSLWRIRRRYG